MRLHGIAKRKPPVCLSVRLSVKRVDCDKTKESSAQILIPHERKHPSFLTNAEEWFVGATLST